MLNLRQNRKNALDKISETFVNGNKVPTNLQKGAFSHFYPTDLVNTKTTSSSGDSCILRARPN